MGDFADDVVPDEAELGLSYAARAAADGVENEKCVVAQYRTTVKQKDIFRNHMDAHPRNKIPVEWVIDIADESNGWFYGTAYSYNAEENLLHVMVPDKDNPSFDGDVLLDHRTVHLVECVDENTHALFNKIVRDSILKIRWEVEWFEEGEGGEDGPLPAEEGGEQTNGKWVLTTARYYIRIANQLLVEEVGFAENANKGFVMLTADLNVKLRCCHKGKGCEDFLRLMKEGIVQSTPDAAATAAQDVEDGKSPSSRQSKGYKDGRGDTGGAARKLAEMARGLKDCLSDVLDDREKVCNDRSKMAKAFKAFALMGDLDSGMKLLGFVDDLDVAEQDALDAAADEAWFLCQKVEKGALKILKSEGGSLDDDAGGSRPEE
jgi:hypothetical protein